MIFDDVKAINQFLITNVVEVDTKLRYGLSQNLFSLDRPKWKKKM